MTIIVVNKTKKVVIDLRRKAIGIVRRARGYKSPKGGISVENRDTGRMDKICDVFVAVVEVVGGRG